MKKLLCVAIASMGALLVLTAQDARIIITGGERRKLGIPDFRGTADAQNFMGAFNQTLWDDVKGAGLVDMVPKTNYPIFVPQQPSDFKTPVPPPAQSPRGRDRQQMTAPSNGGGTWMTDWSSPPAQLNYLAFGYTAAQSGVLVLSGWLYDMGPSTANHQVIGKRYLGTTDEAGARKVAHEFAADIIAAFGGKTTFGTHIYFVSSRTAQKEIWAMDPDGKNQ